ncbi:MAG TPA: hypothetical protein EYH22_00245, partial [Candidatus Nanopusillus sp.]|nr:hypothetical protein [Candidatus Nanopusillus sp.]
GQNWYTATYNPHTGTCLAENIDVSGFDTININIKAVDVAGNYREGGSITAKVDNNPPHIQFDPSSQGWTNKNITVVISATDSESGVEKLYYTVITNGESCPSKDSGQYNEVLGNSGTVDISDEGEWIICAYAVDNVGNSANIIESGVYQIDTTPPSIEFNIPEYIKNLGTISAIVTDHKSGVSEVKVQISYEENGKTYYWDSEKWSESNQWLDMVKEKDKYVYNASNIRLKDGILYKVIIKAIDTAGNEVYRESNTTADLSPPNITFNYGGYTPGSWVKGHVDVTITANDLSGISSIEYSIVQLGKNCNETSYMKLPSNNIVSISVDGRWRICIHAIDTVGNSIYEDSDEIWIDNTEPLVNISTPHTGSYTKGVITILGTASDNTSGINRIEVHINDEIAGEAQYNSTTGKYEYELNTSLYADGTHQIKVVAYDMAGNSNETVVDIIIDNTPPKIEMYNVGLNYSGSSWIGGQYTNVEINVSENIGPVIYSVYLDKDNSCSDISSDCGTLVANLTNYIEDTSKVLTLGQEDPSAKQGWGSITSGDYYMHMIAKDKAGNIDIKTIQVKVDKDAPTIEFIYKDANGNPYTLGSWINEDVIITVNVIDERIGVDRKLYKIINSSEDCSGDMFHQVSGNINISTDGEWKVCIYAEDKLGNNDTISSGIIRIDKTKPQISIQDMPKYITTPLPVKINITATDVTSGLREIKILVKDNDINKYYNGSNWVDDEYWINVTVENKMRYTYELSLNDLNERHSYTIEAKAIDNAGNERGARKSFIYDAGQPELNKIIQLNLTHVKLLFSENVRSVDSVRIDGKIYVWYNGIKEEDTAVIECEKIDGIEAICSIDKPLPKEIVSFDISKGTIEDLAGNKILLSYSVPVENAADMLFKIPVNQWTYIALEYEIDTQYELYKRTMVTTEGTILTYIGNWMNTILRHPLTGYIIRINSNSSSGYYYLPVRYKDKLSEDVKNVKLVNGWNLIAVIGDSTTKNGNIGWFADVGRTSLESLATPYGLRYYKFAWIIDAITKEYRSGENKTRLDGWVKDCTPYWIYMLEDVEYAARDPPTP